LIVANPMALVDLPRIPPSRRRALSDEEVGSLVGAMEERYRALVLTCAFCALRPGEAVAVRCPSSTS
jgi:integrase